jgi:GTP cyclohydrolase II
VQAGHDIAVPLVGVNFNWASRLSYAAMAMLRLLNITRVNLLTNNPAKIAALVDNGIIVDGRTAVIGRVTPENKNYLKTKRNRAGHLLDIETLMSRS